MWRGHFLQGLTRREASRMSGVAVSRDMDGAMQLAMENMSSRIVCFQEEMRCLDSSRVMIFAGVRDSGLGRAMRFRETSSHTTEVRANCTHRYQPTLRP